MGSTSPAGQERLATWLETLTGGRAGDWKRLVSGNSRTTWAVDVERGAEVLPLIVRVDGGDGPFSETPLTLAREAGAYGAIQGRGVAIPRLYGYDDSLLALATERVEGAPAWDDEVRAAVLTEAANLHRVDAAALELPGFGRTAREELELWAAMAAARIAPASPFADFAFDFLRERFPGEPERTVFVHGDLGVGNTMWAAGRVTALLDWEMSHLGDPHDDLAFLSVRSALHELPGDGFAEAVRTHYAPQAGLTLDPGRLRYWQAVGVLRNLVICLASVSNPSPGKDRFVHFMLIPSLNRLLMGTLATLAGVELPAPEELGPPPDLPGAALMREFGRELADLPDEIADPERRQRLRRMRFLFTQLIDTWPLAAEIAAREQGEAPASDAGERLVQLAAAADRRLAMFPRAVPMATCTLPGLEGP